MQVPLPRDLVIRHVRRRGVGLPGGLLKHGCMLYLRAGALIIGPDKDVLYAVFIDCEYTLFIDLSLISIGLVAENGDPGKAGRARLLPARPPRCSPNRQRPSPAAATAGDKHSVGARQAGNGTHGRPFGGNTLPTSYRPAPQRIP